KDSFTSIKDSLLHSKIYLFPLPPLPPLPPISKSRGWLFQSGFAKLTHIKFAIKYFQLATPED
ncbi:hypothetical protein, partial [Nostoc sp. UHCC 0252]|uniref:hypothetical protein n=1 Tax=Nostoc sp. UHCC 0252 TaxID=3110241 RepID=UPI002B21D6A2